MPNVKVNNNCSPDKIPFLLLQNFLGNGKYLLSELNNKVWLCNIILKIWEKYVSITSIPIKKQNKHKPSEYRSIQLG